MLAGLSAVEFAASPGTAQTVLRCGLALGGFGAMALWARLNRMALDQQNWCDCAAERMTVRVIVSHRPEPARVEAETLEEVAS